MSQNITTGNAEIPIKHRREDSDEMTRDKWCGTRYFGLKLIHQRRLSPNIFPSKYILVTWPGNSFLLPWQCDMTQATDNLHHNEMFHETLLHTQNHGNSDFLLLSSDQCSILLVVIGNVTGVEMIQCYPMSLSDVWTQGLTMGQCWHNLAVPGPGHHGVTTSLHSSAITSAANKPPSWRLYRECKRQWVLITEPVFGFWTRQFNPWNVIRILYFVNIPRD